MHLYIVAYCNYRTIIYSFGFKQYWALSDHNYTRTWRLSYHIISSSFLCRVQVQYYGLIQQVTGEDWENAKISLSTAQPSVGGSAPPLNTKIIRFKRPNPRRYYAPCKNIAKRSSFEIEAEASFMGAAFSESYDPTIVSSIEIACTHRGMLTKM